MPGLMCGPVAAQLALSAHHGIQNRCDTRMPHQWAVGLGLAVQQRVEPHVADRIQPFLPPLFLGIKNSLPYQLCLPRRQGAFQQEQAVLFQLVQFLLKIIHRAYPSLSFSWSSFRLRMILAGVPPTTL